MKRQELLKEAVWCILILMWMVFIFYMSAQPGNVSGDISGGVSHWFMKLWNTVFFQGWDEAEVLLMAEKWNYPIRKLAHMTEFGILAALAYRGTRTIAKRYVVTFAFVVLYAATDEIHQLFVPGRSGSAIDVCIDAIGVALVLFAIKMQTELRNRKR